MHGSDCQMNFDLAVTIFLGWKEITFFTSGVNFSSASDKQSLNEAATAARW
jgi:hypothetical protein